ncbi:MAG: phosphomevalonate kinase [Candidatus Diapherotrites archaeon]|uniref:phosphomevalonate kinase n=1 Tax=Candidatus Iainarchaeum sp. TaxID=3101447 RepID=A0A8T5GFL9_9ARCH|nr:phosphomevalonate kinase [Candidatus Diapherotrites archaeon]MBT7241468.1 phosphomevalonate kinase [Candidatus Diapherotrites archaeon]
MKISAPGKLMLSGEWSVLENGVPCIVMAIDQKVSVEINEAEEITLDAKGTDFSVKANFKDKKLEIEGNDEAKGFFLFVGKAIESTLNYLSANGIEIKNFSIETNSTDTVVDLGEGKKAKVGFGSSAAIVAATVASVLALHGEDITTLATKEKVYKLGCITHFSAQGKIGSSFDIAASTYGGALVYQKPDMKWLMEELASGKDVKSVLESEWPLFRAEPIEIPQDLLLSVGFVGYSASTKELVVKINEAKETNRGEYDTLIADIKSTTEKLIEALKTNNKEEIISLLKENRVLLKKFSDWSSNDLETKELTLLSDLADEAGAVGKFSGAGGGDCGIAISFNQGIKEKVENAWKENNIYLISANISKEGVLNS